MGTGRLHVIPLAGELDLAHAAAFAEHRRTVASDASIDRVCLDLRQVTFIDSTVLGFLAGLLRELLPRGGSVSVVGACPPVANVLRLAGMHRVVQHLDAVPDA